MPVFYLKSGAGATVYSIKTWNSGDKMVPARTDVSSNVAVAKRWVWETTTAGLSSSASPTWPASVTQDVTTITDGATTWTARKPGFSSGTTADWTFATIYIDYAMLAMAAGDTLYVSNNHAESTSTTLTVTSPGTQASRCYIICGSDAVAPPTAVSTTATVTTTGNSNIIINGSVYVYGVTFVPGSGSSATASFLCAAAAASNQTYDNCSIQVATTGNGLAQFGDPARADNNEIRLINTTFKFGGTGNRINIVSDFEWDGGSILSGGSTPTSLFLLGSRSMGRVLVSGVDFSNLAATFNIFINTASSAVRPILRNYKLPTSWSGSLWNSAPTVTGMRAEAYNGSASSINYDLWIQDYTGSITDEVVIVRTGGASDGVTPISWKLASSANAAYPANTLISGEIAVRNAVVGSPKTVTVEFIHDTNVSAGQGAGTGFRFQDDEIWLEVMSLNTSGFPLGTWTRDCKADFLAAPQDQTDSSETWTTTGLTTPQKQALSVTFTPNVVGYILARVVVAKASKTIYVDPKLTVA